MTTSGQFLKRLIPALALMAVGLILAGCNRTPPDIAGRWTGRAGTSDLVMDFRLDGKASISVTVGDETSTTNCNWSLVNNRICISNARGQARWFSILDHSPGQLKLRLDSGPAGICELRRSG